MRPSGSLRPRPPSPRTRLLVLGGVLLLTLTACSSDELPTFAMPERDATDQAPRILSLWQGSWIAAFAVGIITWALILWPVVAHRRKRDATGLALVSGWVLLPGGERVEISERHEQRAYAEREIVDAVAEAGLTAVEVMDFDPFKESGDLDADGVKLFFVCRAR